MDERPILTFLEKSGPRWILQQKRPFVGQALGCKVYRILDPETEAVKICKVVNEREKSSHMENVSISQSTPTEKNEAQQIEVLHLNTMDNSSGRLV